MTVTFQIENGGPVVIECSPGENLLDLARRACVPLDAPCSGSGSCGKCRVKLLAGELEALPSRHISQAEFESGWRLSCSCRVVGDCTVLVPAMASAYRSRIKTADLSAPREIAIFEETRTRLREGGICFQNGFAAPVLTMEEPTLADVLPDNERLSRALRAGLGVARVEIPFPVMEKLARVLRKHHFRVCVKGCREGDTFRCLDICAPEDNRMVGCALDIGTTTVTMVLTDLETGELLAKGSAGNGQIRYGADVINRIIQQGKPGGIRNLRSAIAQETVNPLLETLCDSAGIQPDGILHLAVAANTTMNHLLLGVDAGSVRMEPYVPSFLTWEGLKAGDLDLRVNPEARVYLSPNIGAYVGGDITAGVLASEIWNRDAMTLFVDLGTNGEIVFGNREFLVCCACSAGPAFEGGDISCGMRATDGAIEAVQIDKNTLEPTLSLIGPAGQKPAGICGSGIIDLVAELFRTGALDARGRFIREGRRILRDSYGLGRYVLAFPQESETGREISLNEVDIDNFIRAKAAIYSAIDTLLQSVGMDAQAIEEVLVAGGIGSGIQMKNAVAIGMFPDLEPEKFRYIGNSSLTGAYALVLSDQAREVCAQTAENMTYLELSAYPGYMDAFVGACFLPHTDRSRFPNSL